MSRRALTLAALAAFAIPTAALLAAKTQREKADVPLDQVPRAVVAAAQKEVPGISLTEAKRRPKKSGVIYKLEGLANGREYEFKITAAGSVLELEVDDDDGRDDEGRPATATAGGATPDDESRSGSTSAPAGPDAVAPARTALVGTLRHPPIRESSGVVASRKNAGVYWTHNDGGNPAAIYAVREDGMLLAEHPVAAANDDWEDVAADERGNLYVGNVGNNKAKRPWLEVHRLAEPAVGDGPAGGRGPSLKPDKTWRLKYPGKPFNCESLFVHGSYGYVISKLFTGESASLFRFSLDGPTEAILEKVADLAIRAPVTGADLSRDGRSLAVLSTGGLYLVPVDEGMRPKADGTLTVIPLPAGKLEGVCFSDTGLLLTAEGRQMYRVRQ